MKIPVSKPYLSGNELKYVTKAIKDSWISSRGEFIEKFENKFSSIHGTKYGAASSSGTNALILALRALNIGEGDEVIVPEFTMVATAWAVSYTGAKPVFVDCGDDLNIDVSKIEEKITPRTKAIIPVHIYGKRANMEKIIEIAYEYNLYVIEDSCEAHGVPITGDIACFSLYGNKIITAGEGGICITNSKRLSDQMKHLRGMAFNKEHTFLHKKFAYNFRMTNLQAAVALAQTEKLKSILKKRKQIEKWYNEGLRGLPVMVKIKRDVLWYYDILAPRRDELMKYLADNGIETRVFFKPMSQQPMYFNPDYKKLKAYYYSLKGLYLPTFTQMTKKEVDYVCQKIREFYGK